ncbi:magnesium transporter CorA family protein, partial [Enterococcus cecorum]
YIIDLMKKYLDYNNQISVVKFLFVGLFLISESYFPYIEALDKKQEEVSRKLREKITKSDLLTLSDIATGMIYLVAATNQNTILLEQIKGQIIYKQFDKIEREQYVDSLIEAKQLSSMTQLNSEIIQQLYSTYDNILNNNLNDHMAVLTVLSIFLAISATVTGFFGMNVTLPIKNSPYAWLVIIGICLVLCLIYALILRIILWKK